MKGSDVAMDYILFASLCGRLSRALAMMIGSLSSRTRWGNGEVGVQAVFIGSQSPVLSGNR